MYKADGIANVRQQLGSICCKCHTFHDLCLTVVFVIRNTPCHCVLLHNLCHLHVSSPCHPVIVSSSTISVTSMSPHHVTLSIVSSSTISVTSMSPHHVTLSLCPPPQSLSPPCLLTMSPCHCVLLHNLCHLHVSSPCHPVIVSSSTISVTSMSPHHVTLSVVSSSTISVTSMSPHHVTLSLCHPPQSLSPPCLLTMSPCHCVILHNLCHLHVSSPCHPVRCVILHNLCHLHVSSPCHPVIVSSSTISVTSMSPHHVTLSVVSSSTISVTSMSPHHVTLSLCPHPQSPSPPCLLTMSPCSLCHPPQSLSPPCLLTMSPCHCVLIHNLCHLHVSSPCHPVIVSHPQSLSPPCHPVIVSSSTISVTSMSPHHVTLSLCPHPQSLSPPCLLTMSPCHCVLIHNLCHLHVSSPCHPVIVSHPQSLSPPCLLTMSPCREGGGGREGEKVSVGLEVLCLRQAALPVPVIRK